MITTVLAVSAIAIAAIYTYHTFTQPNRQPHLHVDASDTREYLKEASHAEIADETIGTDAITYYKAVREQTQAGSQEVVKYFDAYLNAWQNSSLHPDDLHKHSFHKLIRS